MSLSLVLSKKLLLGGWVLSCLGLTVPLLATTDVDARTITCGRAPKQARIELGSGDGLSEAHVGKQKGGLAAQAIQSVVRGSFASFRTCYEASLRPCPKLDGRVLVHFTIQPKTGRVSKATAESDLGTDELHRCIVGKLKELQFPTFEGPPLKVTYPIMFGG